MQQKFRLSDLIKPTIFLVLLILFIVLGRWYDFRDYITEVLKVIDQMSWLGLLAYAALYILGSLILIPGSILAAAAGFLFGLPTGLWLGPLASLLGVSAAFLVSRYFARDLVARLIGEHKKLKPIDTAIGREGWRVVWLLRLTPLTPINFLNYFLGVTKISLKDYMSASFLGMLHLNILYVYIGSITGNIAARGYSEIINGDNQGLQLLLYGLGLILTIIAVVYITRFAKKALAESLKN